MSHFSVWAPAARSVTLVSGSTTYGMTLDAGGWWRADVDALERCNTDAAPWYVVPADRKWYRNWAVMNILVEQLEAMKVTWPAPDYDPEEQRQRLLASD